MSAFSEGYDAFVRLHGANAGAGHAHDYVKTIEYEIEKLCRSMNNPARKIDKTSIDTLKGFTAEWWQAGTYNINAAVKGDMTRAIAPDDNGLVDIVLTSGEEYSLKYYKYADRSAAQQAKTNYERYMEYCAQYRSGHNGQNPPLSQQEYIKEKFPNDPYYLGQGRLIPSDQLKDAQVWLKQQIAVESHRGRAEQVKRYQEALDMLTDRIKSGGGTESVPLTEAESRELARLAKEGGFDPKKWGLSTAELIELEDIMRQAFHAGLSAALISVALKVGPEICGIIVKLIDSGEVTKDDFMRLGFNALQGGSEGFVRGTVAAAVTISCKSGMMGTAFKTIDPTVIGVVTALALNTIKNACLMSFGKLSKYEFADRCAQDLVVAACSVGGGAAGAAIASGLLTPVAAVFGYMVGSFVGSVVGAFVYKGISSCVLSFCVESGSTFFGLVEQNYTLPLDVLKSMGMKVFEYEKFVFKQFEPKTFEFKRFEAKKFEPVRINTAFLRRGVIGVGAIGYL